MIQIVDTAADAEYVFPESIKLGKNLTLLGVPLLREGEPIGVISFGREHVEPFTSERQVELVRTFADQAVIAMENAPLLSELQKRQTELARSVDELTATGDVLKIISRSSVELETVLSRCDSGQFGNEKDNPSKCQETPHSAATIVFQ